MKTINKLIKEGIKREESYLKEHNEILDILKPLEGKPFTHKSLNKSRLKGFKFISTYGMYYIEGLYSHLIGYKSSNYISIDNFKRYDICHGEAAKKRIEQLKNIDSVKLQKILNKISENFNELRFLFSDIEELKLGSFNNPIYYDMLRNIYNTENKKSSIELNKFYYIRKKRNNQ